MAAPWVSKISFFGFFVASAPVLYLYGQELADEYHLSDDDEEDFAEWAKEEKEIKEEAERIKDTLNDYTFKIFLPCNRNGTGWILDYEIPTDNRYPTKWYIGTNAHVAALFKFDGDPYEQGLPKETFIDKEKNNKFPNFALNKGETCNLDDNGYFDFSLLREENGADFGTNHGAIHNNQMKEPKLFYAPINFLKKDSLTSNNYKDFAVIEVEFRSEGYARKITGDFYAKYGEPTSKKKPLDFLGTEKDIKKEEGTDGPSKRFYTLSYEKGRTFEYSFSYDKDLSKVSRLADEIYGYQVPVEGSRVNALKIDNGRDSQKVKTNWFGRKLDRFGHFYLLNYFAMKGGASGSLVVDGNGRILGIKSASNQETDQSFIVPLKSEKVVAKSFETPEYDLISGGDGHRTSYKQQVQRYIIEKEKKETWLSQKGKWGEQIEKKQH